LLRELQRAPDEDSKLDAWKALLVLDRLLLWKGFSRGGRGRGGKRNAASGRTISARLSLFWSGHWAVLAGGLEDGVRAPRRANKELSSERIRELVEDGAWKRLLSSLRGGLPLAAGIDVEPALRDLLPEENTASASNIAAQGMDVDADMFTQAVARTLRDASPHTAAGRDGGRAAHWQVGSGDDEYEALLAKALLQWLQGDAPRQVDELLSLQNLFALRKPSGGIRPIAVGAFLRRIALKALLRVHDQEVKAAVGPAQYALGRAGGADAAYKALVLELAASPTRAVLSVDMKNAYGTIRRNVVQEAVHRRIPALAALANRLLGCRTVNMFDTAEGATLDIPQGTGVPQGCP